MDPITTIGIDPGLTNVGLSAVNHYGPSPVKYVGDVVVTKGLFGYPRLDYIHKRVGEFLDIHTLAKVVAIEHYDYKGFKLVEMAEISGILKLLCHQKGREVITVSPASVKKFATGRSTATKIQVMYNYQQNNEHIADACALAEIALVYSGARKTTARHKLEVIKQINKSISNKKKVPKKFNSMELRNLDVII